MFNITAFSTEVRDNREVALALVGTNPLIKTYRDALRIVCDDSVWTIEAPAPPPVFSAETLRAELVTSSIAASQYGATDKQINLIISLSEQTGDFAPMGYSRLSRAQASALIADLQKEVR